MTSGIDQLPRRCGRYVLFERLGGGGMAEVYKARIAQRTGPERILVIKLLPERCGPDDAARFIEEAKLALPLTHGNITATFEFDRHEGRPFLVMEYVHGRSLRQILAKCAEAGTPFKVAGALFVCREVARALRYAHNFVDVRGQKSPIVHRDVSPENVLVSYSGQVKLTDFGIARLLEALDVGRAWGKPAYVAPEILKGSPGGPESDVYSLGCVLFESLAGRPPLLGANEAETLDMVHNRVPEPLSRIRSDVPPGVTQIVVQALAKDPKTRAFDAAFFEISLSRLLSEVDPHYTETNLANSIQTFFEEDLRAPADSGDAVLAVRLRDQLHEAGHTTEGHESAAQMLAMGTVALGDGGSPTDEAGAGAAPSVDPSASSPPGPADPNASSPPSPVKPPPSYPQSRLSSPSDLDQPSAGGALLVTAIGLAALIIGGVIALVINYQNTTETDGRVVAHNGDSGTQPDSEPPRRDGDALSKADSSVAASDADGPTKHSGNGTPRRRFGTASFNSDPWSYVYVDGQKLGHTPISRHKLRAGQHRVKFVNPELKVKASRRFRVPANGHKHVTAVLR